MKFSSIFFSFLAFISFVESAQAVPAIGGNGRIYLHSQIASTSKVLPTAISEKVSIGLNQMDSPYFLTDSDFEQVRRLLERISELEEQNKFADIIPVVEEITPFVRAASDDNEVAMGFINGILALCYYYTYSEASDIPDYIMSLGEPEVFYSILSDSTPREVLAEIMRDIDSKEYSAVTANGREEKLFSSQIAATLVNSYSDLSLLYYQPPFSDWPEPVHEPNRAQAQFLLQSAMEIGELHLDEYFTSRPYAGLLLLRFEQGNVAGHMDLLEEIIQAQIDKPRIEESDYYDVLLPLYYQIILSAIDVGDFAKAERVILLSEDIMRSSDSLRKEYNAVIQWSKSVLYLSSGRYDLAISNADSVLSEIDWNSDEDSIDADSSAISILLALAYLHRGDTSKAKSTLSRIESMYEKHSNAAFDLNSSRDFSLPLAIIAFNEGDYQASEKYLDLLLPISEWDIIRLALGQRNTAEIYSFAGIVSHSSGQKTKAKDIFADSLEKTSALSDYTLYYGSESQKISFIKTLSEILDPIISIHLTDPHSDLDELAFLALLEKKGRVIDFFSSSYATLTKDAYNEEARSLLSNISITRNQISDLFFSSSSGLLSNEELIEMSQLQSKLSELEARASREASTAARNIQIETHKTVSAQIPKGAVLIDFLIYQPIDLEPQFNELSGEARYAAYLLRDNGSIEGIDLGSVDEIDPLIKDFQRVVRNTGFDRDDIVAAAKPLYDKVMAPIRDYIADSGHILLAPDGALNLIPFEALVDEDGEYLVENYILTYLTSSRDLLRLQTDTSSQTEPLLLSDPIFEMTGSPSSAQASSTRYVNLRERSWISLPGSGEEADSIAILAQLPQDRNLQGIEATEAALKQVEQPRFLHVATHGFFESQKMEEKALTINPLLRSGLVLSGVKVGQSGTGEDGIVSALEVSSLNLLGTQLAVLSACETGLGDLSAGEGVYGLRRSLALAGSESQLISLWRVQDDTTRDLMVKYYEYLLSGTGRSEAMQKTQLSMLNDEATAHPYYWSAFINSGDWTPISRE